MNKVTIKIGASGERGVSYKHNIPRYNVPHVARITLNIAPLFPQLGRRESYPGHPDTFPFATERGNAGKMAHRDSREDYENLCGVIQRWNERRVELFRISLPNEVVDPFEFGLACCSHVGGIGAIRFVYK